MFYYFGKNNFQGFCMLIIKDFMFNLLFSAVILVFGWWFSSVIGRWFQRAVNLSAHIDATVVPMLKSLIVWSIRIFTSIAVLSRFGVQTASIIAVLGAAGLAIGLALQGTLQNIAAGIMLLLLRPIRVGEYISLKTSEEGVIQEVGLFLTKIIQPDGIHLSLPNSMVWNSTITNFSRNTTRRVDIPVFLRYEDDIELAIQLIMDVVLSNKYLLKDPEPLVKVVDFRELAIVVNIRAWSNTTTYWDFRWCLYNEVWKVLRKNGFKSPIVVRELSN
ncbi:mechanosensitive ion channel [Candidatus Kinetoplastibacterium crithidii TCC036E]|uniref:Small-conductance mechanosensitive channel n=2 Tax=Candidatus Kinetoplastidibacterium crithidiae TaxID=33056 RepID=M1LTM2_9PROT|nr:small conductance mechanosensitive channel [Candidatus Kinetoplastibacterium crithidii (ex Angomonas deanei ATCC 30255)]AGF47451.1 mechanosensitive ion channel [Candidatus Kinetoplastibacterium crithidii TCC036E]